MLPFKRIFIKIDSYMYECAKKVLARKYPQGGIYPYEKIKQRGEERQLLFLFFICTISYIKMILTFYIKIL